MPSPAAKPARRTLTATYMTMNMMMTKNERLISPVMLEIVRLSNHDWEMWPKSDKILISSSYKFLNYNNHANSMYDHMSAESLRIFCDEYKVYYRIIITNIYINKFT